MSLDRWLGYCVEKARCLPYTYPETRVYAVVLDKRGRIVSESSNSYTKTHPRQAMLASFVGLPHKIYGHAELLALNKDKRLQGRTLVVARVDSTGTARNANPCPICRHAINTHGKIKTVKFSS